MPRSKVKINLRAEIVIDNGRPRLKFRSPAYYHHQMENFRNDRFVIVSIENEKSTRSNNQNRYLWGVVYEIISETTGHTPEEVHEWAKTTFLPPRSIKLGGVEAKTTQTTTQLSKAEFGAFLDKLRLFSEKDLNAYIPTPHEAGYLCMKKGCMECKEILSREEEKKIEYPDEESGNVKF